MQDIIVPEGSEFEGVPFYKFKRRTAQQRFESPIDYETHLSKTRFRIADELLDVDARTIPYGEGFNKTMIEISVVQVLPLLIMHGPKRLSKSQCLTQQFHLAVIILHELAVSLLP